MLRGQLRSSQQRCCRVGELFGHSDILIREVHQRRGPPSPHGHRTYDVLPEAKRHRQRRHRGQRRDGFRHDRRKDDIPRVITRDECLAESHRSARASTARRQYLAAAHRANHLGYLPINTERVKGS